jgi:hypothetical protein
VPLRVFEKTYRKETQRELCPQPREFYREGAKDAKLREGKIGLNFTFA